MPTNSAPRIAYFGHNRRDTAFQRRIRALLDAKIDVVTFTFRRDGEPEHPGPEWTNVDLGYVEHAKLFSRMALYLLAIRSVVNNRELIGRADVIYARNLDISVFALLATRLAMLFRSSKHKFVYECLDVHEALTGEGLVSTVLRWIERWVLRAASLLVVSSPGFLRNYFWPVQQYAGPHLWVENKLYFGSSYLPRIEAVDSAGRGAAYTVEDRLTIGWVGIIRCQRTLDLLKAVAVARPEQVTIRISGLISYFLIPDFDEQIAACENILFAGPYDWPQGLADAYRGIDLVWAQELSRKGRNSDWLIPNRVYEASYFGVPSLSVGDTETSRIVRERGIGYVLPDDSPVALIEFLENLKLSELDELKRKLLAMPATDFVAGPADTAALLEAIEMPRHKSHLP